MGCFCRLAESPLFSILDDMVEGWHMLTDGSKLIDLKGIGEKKLAKVLKKFNTREKLTGATPEELASTAGVNINTANELYNKIREL